MYFHLNNFSNRHKLLLSRVLILINFKGKFMRRFFLYISIVFSLTVFFLGCSDVSERDDASLWVSLPSSREARVLDSGTGKYSSADVSLYRIRIKHSNGSAMAFDTAGEMLYLDNLPEGFCSLTVMAIAGNGDIVAQGNEDNIALRNSETTSVNMKLLFKTHLKIMSGGKELSVLKGYKGTMRDVYLSIIPDNITFDQLDINYDDPSLMEFMILGGSIEARFNKSGISTVRFSRDGREFLMSVEVKSPEGLEIRKTELLDGNDFYDASGFWNTKFSEGYVYDAQRKFQFGGISSSVLQITDEILGRPILDTGMYFGPVDWQAGDYINISKTLNNNVNCIRISHCDFAGTEKSSYVDSNGGVKILGPWGFLYLSEKTEIIFLTKYGKRRYEELKSRMDETDGIAFFGTWTFGGSMVSSSNITGLDDFWSNPHQ